MQRVIGLVLGLLVFVSCGPAVEEAGPNLNLLFTVAGGSAVVSQNPTTGDKQLIMPLSHKDGLTSIRAFTERPYRSQFDFPPVHFVNLWTILGNYKTNPPNAVFYYKEVGDGSPKENIVIIKDSRFQLDEQGKIIGIIFDFVQLPTLQDSNDNIRYRPEGKLALGEELVDVAIFVDGICWSLSCTEQSVHRTNKAIRNTFSSHGPIARAFSPGGSIDDFFVHLGGEVAKGFTDFGNNTKNALSKFGGDLEKAAHKLASIFDGCLATKIETGAEVLGIVGLDGLEDEDGGDFESMISSMINSEAASLARQELASIITSILENSNTHLNKNIDACIGTIVSKLAQQSSNYTTLQVFTAYIIGQARLYLEHCPHNLFSECTS